MRVGRASVLDVDELLAQRHRHRTGDTVVDGEIAMTESELQTVLKSMRKEGIYIVAIHQHMTGEDPRILFLHYWGKGKAVALAQAVKNALDAQAPGGK